MSIVFTALACSNTPGIPDDLLTGASLLSPSTGSTAPTNTILPSISLRGTVPATTSAAEMMCEGSDSRSEKFRIIDLAPMVGMKRSPTCTPPGRSVTGPESPR